MVKRIKDSKDIRINGYGSNAYFIREAGKKDKVIYGWYRFIEELDKRMKKRREEARAIRKARGK